MPAATSSKQFFHKRVKITGAKPKTADEIKAEYERREFELMTRHTEEIADLYREYSECLEELRKDRAAELAEATDSVVKSLVEEGQRIGKVPWCCCAYTHAQAAMALCDHGITEIETMEETVERREAEVEEKGSDGQTAEVHES